MIRPGLRLLIATMILLAWIVVNFIFFRMTIGQGLGVRYLFIPLGVFLFALYLGARYIYLAFRMAKPFEGMEYLFACMFGFGYPALEIGDGKTQADRLAKRPILRTGGPGKLSLSAGNIALVEDFRGSLRVQGPGVHFLNRYEIIKEYSSLEERYRRVEKWSAHSKDGIEVLVHDIRYRYRLARRDGADKAKGIDALLQYSEEAVIRMIYNRELTEDGIESWEDGVNRVVISIITDFIHRHPVDYLTAPKKQDADPRAEINAELYSSTGRQKFEERGAELIWIDIGHFETPEKVVAEQRVSTWQARLQGDANKERAIGEAQRLAHQEMGRAEAQAGILINIMDSLEAVNKSGDAHQNVRALYLARIAQFLDTMGAPNRLSGSRPDKG